MGWFDIIQADLLDNDRPEIRDMFLNTSDDARMFCTRLYIIRLMLLGVMPSDFPEWLKEFNG